MITNQNTYTWEQLTESDKQLVVQMHCMGYKTNKQKQMRKAFDQATPKIIIGEIQGRKFQQVHADDVMRLKLLIDPIL